MYLGQLRLLTGLEDGMHALSPGEHPESSDRYVPEGHWAGLDTSETYGSEKLSLLAEVPWGAFVWLSSVIIIVIITF